MSSNILLTMKPLNSKSRFWTATYISGTLFRIFKNRMIICSCLCMLRCQTLWNLFQYQDYYIIVGKLYSRVALILGGLRYAFWGVRKGGSIHSAIKMNMVHCTRINYLPWRASGNRFLFSGMLYYMVFFMFLITFFIETITENASTYKSKTK